MLYRSFKNVCVRGAFLMALFTRFLVGTNVWTPKDISAICSVCKHTVASQSSPPESTTRSERTKKENSLCFYLKVHRCLQLALRRRKKIIIRLTCLAMNVFHKYIVAFCKGQDIFSSHFITWLTIDTYHKTDFRAAYR